jgi:hypothetical protein
VAKLRFTTGLVRKEKWPQICRMPLFYNDFKKKGTLSLDIMKSAGHHVFLAYIKLFFAEKRVETIKKVFCAGY